MSTADINSDVSINSVPSNITTDEEPKPHSTPHQLNVVVVKNYPFVPVLYVILIICGCCVATWSYFRARYGTPPTEDSKESFISCILCILGLVFSTIFTIIVLRVKIHPILVGYLVLICYMITFFFALQSISRAYLTICSDNAHMERMKYYVLKGEGKVNYEFEPLENINMETRKHCCGDSIDFIMDFPKGDLPTSCCRRYTPKCGDGLARTRNYTGEPDEKMRMPSGYFIALSESEMNDIVGRGSPVKIVRPPPNQRDLLKKRILRDFYYEKLKANHLPGTPEAKYQRKLNDIVEPTKIGKSKASIATSIGCRVDEAIEKLSTVGWEIQLKLDYETAVLQADDPDKYLNVAWKIPTCRETKRIPPGDLQCNYRRIDKKDFSKMKFMWYISRGITENFVLKNVIYTESCSRQGKRKSIMSGLLALCKKNPARDDTVKDSYLFYIYQAIFASLVLSITVVILLFIEFLIFWLDFSRLRAVFYANLPFPPEFEELRVRPSDLYLTRNEAEFQQQAGTEMRKHETETGDTKA